MIDRIAPLLNKVVPTALAVKGIQKVNPRLGKFLTSAVASGFGMDEAIDFLRNRFGNQQGEKFKAQLQEKGRQGKLRPDEEAAQESIRQSERTPNAIGTGARLGATLAGGIGGLVSSALLGEDSQQAQSTEQQQEQPQSKDPLELLQGYSPELVDFIKNNTQNKTIEESVSLAKKNTKLAPIIEKIEKELGKDLLSIIREMFGQQSYQTQPLEEVNSMRKLMGGPARYKSNPTQETTSMRDLMNQQAPQNNANNRLAQALQQYAKIRGKL